MNIPHDMDVPEIRRDLTDLSNVRWLLRNLEIRNNNHPEIKTVLEWCKHRVRREHIRARRWQAAAAQGDF